MNKLNDILHVPKNTNKMRTEFFCMWIIFVPPPKINK